MAIRILPFRQYDENDVVNLFSMDEVNSKPSDTNADAGMLVSVSAKDMDKDPVELNAADGGLLGERNYPYVARNYYPSVPLKITKCDGGVPLGITLAQTLTHDENDENLLRYPQKKAELYAVTSGEAVPVATKGIFTLAETAFSTAPQTTDTYVTAGSGGNAGKLVPGTSSSGAIGTILGVGTRSSQNGNPDQFEGTYAVVKLDL
jgi:hypothetical protein